MWLQGDGYLVGQGLGMLLLSHLEWVMLLPAEQLISLHVALALSFEPDPVPCLYSKK